MCLLGNIPGFKQLAQMSKLKDMNLGSLFAKDPMMQQAMGMGGPGMGMQMPQMPGLPAGYTPPMSKAQLAQARLQGYSMGPAATKQSDAERKALKERRTREKENKKKNRRK
jgi:signal recognition particle subunit SRP54